MKNLKRKFNKAIFAVATGAAAVCLSVAAFSEFCSTGSITAEAAYYTVSKNNSSLLLPADYSQYLNLTSPTACAADDRYIAVSDGSTIYIYDNIEGVYKSYSHSYNVDATLNSVAQVDFSDGELYFTDASTYLYKLDLSSLTAMRTGITCTTFACENDEVYFATIVNGRVTVASVPDDNADMSAATVIYTLNTYSAPAICCDPNGNLYFTDGIYLYDNSANTIKNLPLEGTVTSCVYIDGLFYISDATGRFSIYNYGAGTVEKYYDGAYSNIDYYDGNLYIVNSASVEKFDCADGDFTDYEICSSSSAEGRLNGAVDAAYVNGKLIIAESGNSRVTIYDEASDGFETLSTDFIPACVSADESSILISGSSKIEIYTYAGRLLYTYSDFASGEEVRGVESVYGDYYAITSGNAFIKITSEDETYSAEKIYKQLKGVGESLSSDVYGNLIVKTVSGSVYTFSEDAFMSAGDAGTLKYTFPAEVHGFFSDYRGDAFGISGSSIISDCGVTISVSSEGCVYQSDLSPVKAVSTFEGRGAYIVYKNYVIYTENLGVPTLNDISTESSYSSAFGGGAAELKVVSIHKNAVEIYFDFSEYNGAECFPYTSHERLTESSKAVVISETSEYYVIGAVSEKTHKYKTGIVLKSSCDEVDVSTLTYSPEGYSSVGFATNDVPIYKFACFSSETGSLIKGGEVVINYAINLDAGYDFCRVQYSYNGIVYQGYVPLAYLIPTGTTSEETTTVSYAYIDVEDEIYTLLAEDGSTLDVSTDEKFTVIGDPYTEDEVKLTYTEDEKTYYTIVDSSLLKTNNSTQIRIFAIIVIGVAIVLVIVNYAVFSSRRRKKRGEDDYE